MTDLTALKDLIVAASAWKTGATEDEERALWKAQEKLSEWQTYLPDLIAEIERLRARIVEMEAALGSVMADTAIMLLHKDPERAAKAKADLYAALYQEIAK